MKSLIAVLVMVAGSLLGGAQGAQDVPENLPQDPTVRFETRDVFVDSGRAQLAAWQVRITDPSGAATIVGVEGGDEEPWIDPPRYDPRALMRGEIVLAAFSTRPDVPSGNTRVARVHLRIEGPADPPLTIELEAAGGVDVASLEARPTLVR